MLELDGGADVAAETLGKYDRLARSWAMSQTSPFWDAVSIARQLGRRGAGATVAVIDDDFDLSYEALSGQELAWPRRWRGSPGVHGTVVALLLLHVAPDAKLVLYPTRGEDGAVSEALVIDALADAAAREVDVINLSMGDHVPTHTVFDATGFFDASAFWPDMTPYDIQAWTAERIGDDFRPWLLLPDNALTRGAEAAAKTSILIASAGNVLDTVSIPAVCDGVYAINFLREARWDMQAAEFVHATPPSYTTSEFSDFAVIQMPDVLGSSFATPLVSGFATLMSSPDELASFKAMGLMGAHASQLVATFAAARLEVTERQHVVIGSLYNRALKRWPHKTHDGPCPDCAFFALPILIDAGFRQIALGYPDEAAHVLHRARQVAPTNAHAAANLGVATAFLADRANQTGDPQLARRLLDDAVRHMHDAVELRADYHPYVVRLAEFQGAQDTLAEWRIAP